MPTSEDVARHTSEAAQLLSAVWDLGALAEGIDSQLFRKVDAWRFRWRALCESIKEIPASSVALLHKERDEAVQLLSDLMSRGIVEHQKIETSPRHPDVRTVPVLTIRVRAPHFDPHTVWWAERRRADRAKRREVLVQLIDEARSKFNAYQADLETFDAETARVEQARTP